MPSIRWPQRVGVGRRLVQCAITVAAAAIPALAQTQLWLEQTHLGGYDGATAVAADGKDGAFVVGYTSGNFGGTNLGSNDAFVAHYDSRGKLIWVRQFGSPLHESAWGALADDMGGVFVCGSTLGDMAAPNKGHFDGWVARFDAGGTLLWLRQIGERSLDHFNALTSDGAGGVYAVGVTAEKLSATSPYDEDGWIARYDGSGSLMWFRKFGTPRPDGARSAAADGSGGVFVAGESSYQSFPLLTGLLHPFLARFDSNGTQQWFVHPGPPGNGTAFGVAGDGAGGAYVGGMFVSKTGPLGQVLDWDAFVAQHDADGVEVWCELFGTESSEWVYSVTADSTGSVYLGGFTGGDLGGPNVGEADAWMARFDDAGHALWMEQIGSNAYDSTAGLAVDALGAVFIVGSTHGALDGGSVGATDAWLARYDGSCNSGKTYCTASSTSIPGCPASLNATGSPTLSDPTAWTLSSGPVPGGNLGLLLFGLSGADNTPYGTLGGKLCVAAPTFRTAPKTSGGDVGQCNGGYAFTLADLIAAAPVVTSRVTIHAQVWARDPANADGFLLSDGIHFTTCPAECFGSAADSWFGETCRTNRAIALAQRCS